MEKSNASAYDSSGSDSATTASNIDYKEANTGFPPVDTKQLTSENRNSLPNVKLAIILDLNGRSSPLLHITEGENIIMMSSDMKTRTPTKKC